MEKIERRETRQESGGAGIAGAATPGKRTLIGDAEAPVPSGGLPPPVRAQMERQFGASFAAVRVHQNSARAEELGVGAFASGDDLHFAAGEYDPHSAAGRELLGHELAHVIQQRQGRVPLPRLELGDVHDDPALEEEAEAIGRRVASGEQVATGDGSAHSTAIQGGKRRRQQGQGQGQGQRPRKRHKPNPRRGQGHGQQQPPQKPTKRHPPAVSREGEERDEWEEQTDERKRPMQDPKPKNQRKKQRGNKPTEEPEPSTVLEGGPVEQGIEEKHEPKTTPDDEPETNLDEKRREQKREKRKRQRQRQKARQQTGPTVETQEHAKEGEVEDEGEEQEEDNAEEKKRARKREMRRSPKKQRQQIGRPVEKHEEEEEDKEDEKEKKDKQKGEKETVTTRGGKGESSSSGVAESDPAPLFLDTNALAAINELRQGILWGELQRGKQSVIAYLRTHAAPPLEPITNGNATFGGQLQEEIIGKGHRLHAVPAVVDELGEHGAHVDYEVVHPPDVATQQRDAIVELLAQEPAIGQRKGGADRNIIADLLLMNGTSGVLPRFMTGDSAVYARLFQRFVPRVGKPDGRETWNHFIRRKAGETFEIQVPISIKRQKPIVLKMIVIPSFGEGRRRNKGKK